MRFAVLVSGNGSNLQALMDACAAGRIQGELVGVLSQEHQLYPLVVNWFCQQRLRMQDGHAWLDGQPLPALGYASDDEDLALS